jgi:hypothetical protein
MPSVPAHRWYGTTRIRLGPGCRRGPDGGCLGHARRMHSQCTRRTWGHKWQCANAIASSSRVLTGALFSSRQVGHSGLRLGHQAPVVGLDDGIHRPVALERYPARRHGKVSAAEDKPPLLTALPACAYCPPPPPLAARPPSDHGAARRFWTGALHAQRRAPVQCLPAMQGACPPVQYRLAAPSTHCVLPSLRMLRPLP